MNAGRRDDGWPRCPWWAEALTTVVWMALNAWDTALEAWDRHINAAAFNPDEEEDE